MQQKKMFPSPFDSAVEGLHARLYSYKIQRSVFTASELASVLFEAPTSHSHLIQLANAMKAAGYKRHNNGRVVRIQPKQHGRYWIVQNTDHNWTDAEVRANVKAHEV